MHETADPEVIVAEFEYRGAIPGTGDRFAIPNVFVIRIRDGQIVESRDYADHAEIARVLRGQESRSRMTGRTGPGGATRTRSSTTTPRSWTGPMPSSTWSRPGWRWPGGGSCMPGSWPDGQLDPATLAQFERAAGLYAGAGDGRGEAEALFWAGTFHQVGRDDEQAARPLLERAAELATAAGDRLTLSYAVRHLGFAEEAAGRLDAARELLAESLRLRRELGFERGVSAALLALAQNARARGDQGAALALLAEAGDTARRAGARGILRRIEAEQTDAGQTDAEQAGAEQAGAEQAGAEQAGAGR